eukprot:362430-Chlamydomonas_euryale.AAC.6
MLWLRWKLSPSMRCRHGGERLRTRDGGGTPEAGTAGGVPEVGTALIAPEGASPQLGSGNGRERPGSPDCKGLSTGDSGMAPQLSWAVPAAAMLDSPRCAADPAAVYGRYAGGQLVDRPQPAATGALPATTPRATCGGPVPPHPRPHVWAMRRHTRGHTCGPCAATHEATRVGPAPPHPEPHMYAMRRPTLCADVAATPGHAPPGSYRLSVCNSVSTKQPPLACARSLPPPAPQCQRRLVHRLQQQRLVHARARRRVAQVTRDADERAATSACRHWRHEVAAANGARCPRHRRRRRRRSAAASLRRTRRRRRQHFSVPAANVLSAVVCAVVYARACTRLRP